MQKLYILTKQEIGDIIVQHIGAFIEGQSFFPYKIVKCEKENGKYLFELEYIPKGTKSGKETEHALQCKSRT